MVNIPFMLGTLASMKLCGNNYYENEWQTLLNFCRFRLTYELDAKVGKQTENGAGYAVSHYKGVARVVPDLDSAGCLRFFLAKEEQQNIHLDLIANEVIAPQRPVYIGTKKGKSPMPDIRLHFCKKDIDTIAFVYSQPDGEGIWDYGGRRIRGWIQANEGIFKNINELTDAAKDLAGKAGGLAAGMKVNAEEMKKKVAELQKNGNSSQEIAIEMKKMLSGEAIPAEMNELLKVTFIVNVNNRNSILVNQKFDARQINPKMNDVIEYGYMTIKLEHDPKK
jgi:hypothetical protein